jgi:hypothetical protein
LLRSNPQLSIVLITCRTSPPTGKIGVRRLGSAISPPCQTNTCTLHADFSKAGARDCLPRSGAVAAWHAVCGSPSLLTVAPVSFYPPPSFGNAVRYPACTKPAPAWTFCPYTQCRSRKKYHASQSPGENAHFPFILISSANKSPPATNIGARPRSQRLRYDFCCARRRVLACRRKNLHCATWHSVTRQVAPAVGTRSEIGHSSLIRFRASRTVIAMKYCNHFWPALRLKALFTARSRL